MTDLQIYRYLRFKGRFVQGTRICRNLGLPLVRIKALDGANGIGSFGPVTRRELSPIRHAKYNGFCADFIAFFKHDGKYLVRKDRPLRHGCHPPKKRQ